MVGLAVRESFSIFLPFDIACLERPEGIGLQIAREFRMNVYLSALLAVNWLFLTR
jgi:hypothetical protein